MHRAFTLLELIMVIVIIGVLAAVAIPKFKNLGSHSKVAAELATASTVQSAIDDVHSDWIMSEGSFEWGSQGATDCSSGGVVNHFDCDKGYPDALGTTSHPFEYILKNSAVVDSKWAVQNGQYRGPASKTDTGVSQSPDKPGKPDNNDYWEYDNSKGTFKLVDN